jgi:hypothetical protein
MRHAVADAVASAPGESPPELMFTVPAAAVIAYLSQPWQQPLTVKLQTESRCGWHTNPPLYESQVWLGVARIVTVLCHHCFYAQHDGRTQWHPNSGNQQITESPAGRISESGRSCLRSFILPER